MISLISQNGNYAFLALEPKVETVDAASLTALLLSILLVVWVKYQNPSSLRLVGRLFISTRNYDFLVKELWPSFHSNAWLLNLNFVVNIALTCYLFWSGEQYFTNWGLFVNALAFSLIFFTIPFFSMGFIRVITGEYKTTKQPVEITWVLPQFLGISLLILNTAHLLNQEWAEIILGIEGVLLVFTLIMRYLRGGLHLIQMRIEWYYILLYLCTLEIIPLLLTVWFFFVR